MIDAVHRSPDYLYRDDDESGLDGEEMSCRWGRFSDGQVLSRVETLQAMRRLIAEASLCEGDVSYYYEELLESGP